MDVINGSNPVEVPTSILMGMTLEDIGYCLACGGETGFVEPDAREYPCEMCGESKVYGAQELLFMGLAVPSDA